MRTDLFINIRVFFLWNHVILLQRQLRNIKGVSHHDFPLGGGADVLLAALVFSLFALMDNLFIVFTYFLIYLSYLFFVNLILTGLDFTFGLIAQLIWCLS